jgi:hypothetical protein
MNILSPRAMQGIDKLAMKAAEHDYIEQTDSPNPFHCDACKDRWAKTYKAYRRALAPQPFATSLELVQQLMELPMFMNQAS